MVTNSLGTRHVVCCSLIRTRGLYFLLREVRVIRRLCTRLQLLREVRRIAISFDDRSRVVRITGFRLWCRLSSKDRARDRWRFINCDSYGYCDDSRQRPEYRYTQDGNDGNIHIAFNIIHTVHLQFFFVCCTLPWTQLYMTVTYYNMTL